MPNVTDALEGKHRKPSMSFQGMPITLRRAVVVQNTENYAFLAGIPLNTHSLGGRMRSLGVHIQPLHKPCKTRGFSDTRHCQRTIYVGIPALLYSSSPSP